MDGMNPQTIIRQLRRLVNPADPCGLTDAELLQRWLAQRDEGAFEALLWRHAAAVLVVCRRVLGDAHEAEDATQAVFLALARQASSIGSRQAVASWLHTVAFRVALRARARKPSAVGLPALVLNALPARPAEDPDWRDLRPVLDEEVSRLPEKYRAPFVLCCVLGRTNEQAASELGCPVGTVLSRLARARRRLRTQLTRRGVTLAPALLAPALAREAAAAVAPGMLIIRSVRAAVLLAAGKGLGEVVSTKVVVLAEGVMRSMFLTKLKLTCAVLFGLTLLGGGGMLTYRTALGAPTEASNSALPPKQSPASGDENKLQEQPAPQEKETRDLQERVKVLEGLLADTTRRLELALLSRGMDEIKERLATGAGGKKTQEMQKDVLDRLDRVIKMVGDRQKKVPDRKLADLLAELRLLRSTQLRVNDRTALSASEYKEETLPAPDTAKTPQEKEQLQAAWRGLKELSERQGKISNITLALASEKKGPG